MELPECTTLLLRLEQGVLWLTLNRPESRNAMGIEMLAEITAVFERLQAAGEVRAVVLRGAGGHFCAGGDLKGMMAGGMKLDAGDADPIMTMNRAFGRLLLQVSQAAPVVIAVCDGVVMGGGFGLACVSDIAYAQVEARFGMPETMRGLLPAQIAPFVVERIGLTQARRLCLTGATVRGAEALRLGLVHETFETEEQLQSSLKADLAQVMQCAPQANALTKQILMNVGRLDMDAVLDDAARKFAFCVRGPEAPEGIAAFMQKRSPKWSQQ